jgi:serine/threonine-protein kinase RsbW
MSTMQQTFSLEVPSSTEHLALIRTFVANVGAQAGLGEEDVGKLELAVDEACANVIEHAHGHDQAKVVTVRASFDAALLKIEVADAGEGFDLDEVCDEPIELLAREGRRGSLGMRMMRSLMDEVCYQIVPGEPNRLRLLKHIKR